jgi:hypothetical protein
MIYYNLSDEMLGSKIKDLLKAALKMLGIRNYFKLVLTSEDIFKVK